MNVGEHAEEFHGLPVFEFPGLGEGPVERASLPAADAVAWRIGVDVWEPEEQWEEAFARFLDTVDAARVRALVIGTWWEPYEMGPDEVLAALVGARDRLPSLRALFLGDIVRDESEVSWIKQGRATDLLEAFPAVEELRVRGGIGLEFAPLRQERLRELVVETAGLPAEAVRGVAACEFPGLAHLELWLGPSEWGGDASVEDLAPILSGERLPALTYLGLCNSEIQDEVCAAVASAPVVTGLEVLDLSMGVLTDEGAAALLDGRSLTHLRRLDLSHNYLSEAMRARLREALEPAGVEVNVEPGSAEQPGNRRFVAVGE
ncbi:STM4015 family protein [Streptomyces sedi]|uniref:Leucine-rich repeat domain-containing protein n=1 Tax=Streptomyces sedi TaxID=555059 RepID=A0A5C4V1H7_9ACTN|nr:STM4015 family protein [Streptomyces sedi]TNM29558.1 leucine-rich repeat domain-containing protein [Streptomyces sedi]